MAKRFTDTEKWRKKWFRGLDDKNKLFWVYLLDSCDFAGIWEVDFELAEIFCGKLNESEIREVFKKQFAEIRDNRKWFVMDFVNFQYGELTETNRMHLSVINTLKREGAYKGYLRGLQAHKDKEQDKDKDKVKEKVKDKEKLKYLDYIFLYKEQYEKLVEKFGQREADEKIDNANSYAHQIGIKKFNKRYSSHYHTILNWERRNDIANFSKTGLGADSEEIKKYRK